MHVIEPALVERIEIVRGSHSSLYGSDAIDGVIQLFTYSEKTEPKTSLSMGYASHDTFKTALKHQGNTSNFVYCMGISGIESDGIDHLISDAGKNDDQDAYKNKIDNIIIWLPNSNVIYRPVDINKAEIQGLEFDSHIIMGIGLKNTKYE